MRVELEYNKYHKNKKGEYEEAKEGVALLEYYIDNPEDESTNNWILELEGVFYYFSPQSARKAIKFLIKESSKQAP